MVHFEVPSVTLPRDSWIGIAWHEYQGDGSQWVFVTRDGVDIGAGHDVDYRSFAPDPPQFDDFGPYVADIYLQVYAEVPVPADPATWGRLKATYR